MNIPVSYAKSARSVQLHYWSGETSGLREVDSLGSIVRVRAGPWRARDMLKRTAPFFVYALTVGDRIYFGSATQDRAIGDRLGKPDVEQIDQIYIIHSKLPAFDRAVAGQVEGRLIELALEAGVPILNKTVPFGRNGMVPSPGFEELMIDVRMMLAAAGCSHLDKQDGKARRSRPWPANHAINNVHFIEPEDWAIPAGARPVRLVFRDLQAEGYICAPRRIRVAPGADWCLTSKSGLSLDNRRRRQDIQASGDIELAADDCNRARLRVGLDCTPAIAAKLISGEHIHSDVWQPALIPPDSSPPVDQRPTSDAGRSILERSQNRNTPRTVGLAVSADRDCDVQEATKNAIASSAFRDLHRS